MVKQSRIVQLLAVSVVLLVSACVSWDDLGSEASGGSKAPASKASKAAPASKAPEVDWAARIKKFEADNAIDRATRWGGVVKKTEVRSGALWIETSLPPDDEAKDLASRICGSYSLFTLDYPEVRTVLVRAGDGQGLAKCGAGA